jgi:FPC/CPF motif-containing protein YcgG
MSGGCIFRVVLVNNTATREISSSHGGEYDVQNCLLGCTGMVDNHFTRQYIPEDNSEQHSNIPLTTTTNSVKYDVKI